MRTWLLLLSLFFVGTAVAADPAAVRKQTEASMLVTGRVTIEQDGSVSAWEVDQREKLPPGVAALVDSAVEHWKFEPVLIDGTPTRGTARMSLRLVVNQLDDGRYELALRSGHFGRDALSREEHKRLGIEDEHIAALKLAPPNYPARALSAGGQGIVYVAVKVGRQGTVEDMAVEQVNLYAVGSKKQMKVMRDAFADSALDVARKWTFKIPTRGEWADQTHWTVRVPVSYRFGKIKETEYGQWQVYIPGQRTRAPWETENVGDFDTAPDALVAGEVYQAGTGLKLLTPLQGS